LQQQQRQQFQREDGPQRPYSRLSSLLPLNEPSPPRAAEAAVKSTAPQIGQSAVRIEKQGFDHARRSLDSSRISRQCRLNIGAAPTQIAKSAV
jgi:hypothetical protein